MHPCGSQLLGLVWGNHQIKWVGHCGSGEARRPRRCPAPVCLADGGWMHMTLKA